MNYRPMNSPVKKQIIKENNYATTHKVRPEFLGNISYRISHRPHMQLKKTKV